MGNSAGGGTEQLGADAAGIARAAALLAEGRLVAFPTETVYGLGADARDPAAVAGIFTAKERPADNPLILHLPDQEAAARIGRLGPVASALAAAFWPGPLTLVVPARAGAGLAPAVTAGLDSIGIRVPAHPVARALLQATGFPVAAPSANPSGRISPTTAAHVLDGLGGRIAAVLDAGPAAVGLESTIIGLTGDAPRLLRPGGIPADRIAAVLEAAGAPGLVAGRDPAAAGRLTAPGQMESHYAPACPVRLAVTDPRPDEAYLAFGPVRVAAAETLSAAGDPDEAAHRLYAALRRLEARVAAEGLSGIAVAPIPDAGLGAAINDRLRRAAAPRPAPGAPARRRG